MHRAIMRMFDAENASTLSLNQLFFLLLTLLPPSRLLESKRKVKEVVASRGVGTEVESILILNGCFLPSLLAASIATAGGEEREN